MQIIAHNIRSLHNVGAIFRSAEAFGIECVHLTGYTGIPPRKEIAKVALGSEHRVPWQQHEDIVRLIQELKGQGKTILALDNTPGAEAIQAWKAAHPNKTDWVLILGNEVEGVEETVLTHVDTTLEIPMPGFKRSLNVSVATGIALFALCAK